jgi:hypothetical protein
MQLNQDDLLYFVSYVLLDEATRPVSGKRQTRPLDGFWMSRHGKTGMRLSDGRLRRNSCIDALRTTGGMSISTAAARVGKVLGSTRPTSVNKIRVDYYEHKAVRDPRVFLSQFLSWRAWVLESSEEALRFALSRYGEHFGRPRRERLAKLMEDLRRDRVQVARNREWLLSPGMPARTRIESNHWNPESDWQFLATDLWVLGQLHAKIGETAEARSLLEGALAIWRRHGNKLVHLQLEAIPQLEELISRLASKAL